MTKEQLQAENYVQRRELDHILSCIVTVRLRNLKGWMTYITEEINDCLERIGDKDRVVVSGDGLRIVRGE